MTDSFAPPPTVGPLNRYVAGLLLAALGMAACWPGHPWPSAAPWGSAVWPPSLRRTSPSECSARAAETAEGAGTVGLWGTWTLTLIAAIALSSAVLVAVAIADTD